MPEWRKVRPDTGWRDTFLFRALSGIIISMMAVLPPTTASATEYPYFYRVVHGDTLSDVLYRFGIKPIYGKSGVLEKTLSANPLTRSKQGDFLRPGEIIRLPVQDRTELEKWAVILESGEVRANALAQSQESEPKLLLREPASAPEPRPTSETAATPSACEGVESADQSLVFEVSPLVGFSSLSGKQSGSSASAKILSKSQSGVRLGVTQNLTSTFFLQGKYESTSTSFETSTLSQMLATSDFKRSEFGLGVGLRSARGSSLALSLVSGNLPYFLAEQVGNVRLLSSRYFGGSLDGNWIFERFGKFEFSAAGAYSYFIPQSLTGLSPKAGNRLRLSLGSAYLKGPWKVVVSPGYETTRYDSDLSTQVLNEMNLQLKIIFEWK